MSKSPITCHVLDSSVGKPAANVEVELELIGQTPDHAPLAESSKLVGIVANGRTNSDGRCHDLVDSGKSLPAGIYKMKFHTGPYFKSTSTPTFYPVVEITFDYFDPSQHFHIPLLISPYSYTTYRGS